MILQTCEVCLFPFQHLLILIDTLNDRSELWKLTAHSLLCAAGGGGFWVVIGVKHEYYRVIESECSSTARSLVLQPWITANIGLGVMGISGKSVSFSPPPSASQGAEQPQMLSPDWSWKFEGQLNLLMFVLWYRVWEMLMRHEAEQLALLLLYRLCSADSS